MNGWPLRISVPSCPRNPFYNLKMSIYPSPVHWGACTRIYALHYESYYRSGYIGLSLKYFLVDFREHLPGKKSISFGHCSKRGEEGLARIF